MLQAIKSLHICTEAVVGTGPVVKGRACPQPQSGTRSNGLLYILLSNQLPLNLSGLCES